MRKKKLEQRRIEAMAAAKSDEERAAVAVAVAEEAARYQTMPPAKLAKLLKSLEREMLKAAQNLDFEQAAAKRDEIHKIRELALHRA